jgi:hypothetical protein
MKIKSVFVFAISIGFYLSSCQPNNKQSSDNDSSANKPVIINPTNNVPQLRSVVKTEPIDQYKEKTDNPLNDWYFSVKLYETPITFHYLIKMQFEEIRGEDTLKLPNFGYDPKPVLKKGNEKYSCIIGFMDDKNVFREYKLVHVSNGSLKITALKHYAVATYQEK